MAVNPGMSGPSGPSDPLEWARHPRTQAAMDYLVEGARNNRELRAIHHAHLAARVCSEEGKLLKRWDGHRWQAW